LVTFLNAENAEYTQFIDPIEFFHFIKVKERIETIQLGYEEPLAPSKHIPDYNIRDKRELSAGLAHTPPKEILTT